MVQSTKPRNKHAPLSLSATGYSSGWFLLAPLRQHLVLRFLEAPRFRCHSLTVNRRRFFHAHRLSTEILAACPFSTSQIILLTELDASRPFSVFPLTFHKTETGCTDSA